MSFSSSVFTIPGSSNQKLPYYYVHSNFKPRYTFAKSFGGRRRYSKVCACVREEKVGKLPQIKYNGTDQRTLITLGSVRRGERREYPGFLGHSKISRRKNRVEDSCGKDDNRNQKGSKFYGSLPDLAGKRHGSKFFNQLPQQQIDEKGSDSNCIDDSNVEDVDPVYNSLESLIFVDDDEPTDAGKSPSSGKSRTEKVNRNGETAKSSSSSGHKRGPNNTKLKTSSESETKDTRRVHYEDETDLLNEEVDKKISEARGKSGMKRGRKKESDHNIRMLGDVMTSKRLAELLHTRNQDAALSFS